MQPTAGSVRLRGRSASALRSCPIFASGTNNRIGVSVDDAASLADGVSLADGLPLAVGDIPAGGSALVELGYRVEKDKPKPCKGVEHGCAFDVALSVEMPDALDKPATHADTVRVVVPTAPGKP